MPCVCTPPRLVEKTRTTMRTVQYNCGPRGDVHDGARDDPILHRERRLSVSVGRRRPKKRPVSVSHCFSSASDSFNLACPSFASDQIPFYSVYSPFHSFSFPFMRRFCSNRLRTAFFSVGRRIWGPGPDAEAMGPSVHVTRRRSDSHKHRQTTHRHFSQDKSMQYPFPQP